MKLPEENSWKSQFLGFDDHYEIELWRMLYDAHIKYMNTNLALQAQEYVLATDKMDIHYEDY